jgi:Tfp pilus assembly protein PilF
MLAAFLAAGGAAACGPPQARTVRSPASPERQSEAEYDIARDEFYRNRPRTALEHVLKACTLNEENARALKFASEIYVSFCDTTETSPDCHLDLAERFARKAVRADDKYLDARNTLGSILILEHKYDDAVAVLKPLTEDPTYEFPHLAWGNIGWAHVLAGRYEPGIRALEHAITQPRFCVGYYRLGIAYEKKGALEQAEDNFSQALAVDSPDCKSLQDAWEERGKVRSLLGKTAAAHEDFERCRDLSSESPAGKTCAQRIAPSGTRGGKANATKPSGHAAGAN